MSRKAWPFEQRVFQISQIAKSYQEDIVGRITNSIGAMKQWRRNETVALTKGFCNGMPGVKTHDLLTLVTAAGADIVYFINTPHPNTTMAALFTASYLFAGYACAGDLDTNSREYRRWGPLRILWWPYRSLVPHRSWVSHGLVLGGLIRAGYLASVCTLVFWVGLWLYGRFGAHIDPSAMTRAEWTSLFGFARSHPQWTLALLTGFVLAGTTHSVADLISTRSKRLRRRF